MGTVYWAILGSPNAGKSSIVNGLVQAPWFGVSPKAQTTRKRLHGVVTSEQKNEQAVIMDTPGYHFFPGPLNDSMRKEIWEGLQESDHALLIIRSSEIWSQSLDDLLEFAGKKLRAVLLNCDSRYNPETLAKIPAHLPILSASPDQRMGELREFLWSFSDPEAPNLIDQDQVALESVRDLITEIGRAVLLDSLEREVPYETAIQIRQMDENEGRIYIDLVLNRKSHKPIVVGERGYKITAIREEFKRRLKKLLPKVELHLFVRVEPDWIKNKSKEFGF